MGKTLSTMVKLGEGKAGGIIKRLDGMLQWLGTRRSRLQQQLEEENIKAAKLATKVEEMDMKLKQREEQVVSLGRELDKQRELREAQMVRSEEERKEFMRRAEETQHILKEIEILKEQVLQQPDSTSNSAIIGQLGEEWVVESLQKAFPNNTSISRTNTNHTGDIIFRVENTGKMIMFEVKDVKKSSIAGINQGKDMEKFFKDFQSCGADGAILISLNGPVDPNVSPLTPQWCDSKPYFYVDGVKTQYPDPVCLLKVSVQMMTCLMELGENKGERADSFHIKIQSYLSTVRLLSGLYQKLYKGNESERRQLEQLKGHLDTLHLKMLRDQEVSQAPKTLTESGDVDGSVLKEVKNPKRGKNLS